MRVHSIIIYRRESFGYIHVKKSVWLLGNQDENVVYKNICQAMGLMWFILFHDDNFKELLKLSRSLWGLPMDRPPCPLPLVCKNGLAS